MKNNHYISALFIIIAMQSSFLALSQVANGVNSQPALTESQYTINSKAVATQNVPAGKNTGKTYKMGTLPHMGTLSGGISVRNVSKTSAGLQIFPNPGKGDLNVKGFIGNTTNNEATISVLDIVGRVVYVSNTNVNNGIVDYQVSLGNNLISGKYIVELRTESDVKRFNYILEK